MQKHLGRVVRFGWLPAIAFAAMVVSDMSTAVINADKNIATLLKNLGLQQPPQQIATYIWEHPWAAIMAVVLVFAVGAGLSLGAEMAWDWLRQKRFVQGYPPITNLKRRIPLHEACRYIATNSVWAEHYSGRDCDWFVALASDVQIALSLGEITAFGHRQVPNYFPERGLTEIPPSFWSGAIVKIWNVAMPIPPHDAVNGNDKFVLVELAAKDVTDRWPQRSSRASRQKISPVERAGGYDAIWAEQDRNFPEVQENLWRTALEIMYPND